VADNGGEVAGAAILRTFGGRATALSAPAVMAEWHDRRGEPCRAYLRNVQIDGQTTTATASVCRQSTGQWAMSATEPPPGLLGRDDWYCPQPGTTVETSAGGYFLFTRGDGARCWYRMRDGSANSRYAHLLGGDSAWLAIGGAKLKDLWPLEIGKTVWFVSNGISSNGYPSTWYETYRVVGRERVAVPAGTFDTYVIEWEEQGREGSSYRAANRFWFAPEVGYFVKFRAASVPYNTLEDWDATRVVVPQPTRAVAERPASGPAIRNGAARAPSARR